MIMKTDFFWLIAGAICYGCNYFFRSYRLWIYTNKTGSLIPIYLKITGIHGFNSYFLPMRSGDLTLPFLLRLHAEIPLALGGRILVRARVLDISSLGYLLFLATLLTTSEMPAAWRSLMMVGGIAFVIIPYVALYIIRHDAVNTNSWLRRIIGEGKPEYPALLETLVSLGIWFWIGCTIYCVIRSLAVPLSFYDVWLLVAIQLPLQMFPVQGLANSGNHEAGWVLALGLFGISATDGLPIALASHAVFISYAILLGAVALALPSGKSGTANLKRDSSAGLSAGRVNL
jgi:uncharacterized membrane protein YbhN (UPF0104 family)